MTLYRVVRQHNVIDNNNSTSCYANINHVVSITLSIALLLPAYYNSMPIT